MLSSRVDDPGSSLPDGTTMRELRDASRERGSPAVELPGADERLFDVFVNEGEAALAGDGDVERHCREQIRKADIVLVLYNGSAGWASQGLEGICQIELRAAMETAPHKVRIIRLPLTRKPTAADKLFRAYAEAQRPFSTDQAYDTTADIAEQCLEGASDCDRDHGFRACAGRLFARGAQPRRRLQLGTFVDGRPRPADALRGRRSR